MVDDARVIAARLFAVVIVFWAVVTAVGAVGAEKKWRILDPLGKFNTSTCIGDPKTPMCAVETYLACYENDEKSLCDAVGYQADGVVDHNSESYQNDLLNIFVYRETGRHVLRESDIPQSYDKWQGKSLKAGDMAIRTISYTCFPDFACLRERKWDAGQPYGTGCRRLDVASCNFIRPEEVTVVVRKSSRNSKVHWTLVGIYAFADLSDWFAGQK